MKKSFEKYQPFKAFPFPERTWPNKVITKVPIWCSVDMRDGNQALVNPMNLEQKVEFFNLLVKLGFKEIEIGFPSASETEYEILRTLINQKIIPDDVTIQVLVQSREHLIRKTFDAIRGAKNVILHFYNSTSTLQRKVVFGKDMDGIIDIAVSGAKIIRELAHEMCKDSDMNLRFEYSPESFSGTETDNAIRICDSVVEALGSTADNKVILNLPNTVELSTPNTYADQIEYFCKNLKHRDKAIISLHPHNDRGTGTAATELGLMAGAERVEGTLFGNGERTGNCDIVNVALNMFTQGIDPVLDFSDINEIKEVYEKCNSMKIAERHPYVGELVFTAFSGSHQDAINKGVAYMQEHNSEFWEIPYLPIDPADVGRQYEPIIRINSQSGKGGAAFIMQQNFGFTMPKRMHAEFGTAVKNACDQTGREVTPKEVYDLFMKEYIEVKDPYHISKYKIFEEKSNGDSVIVDFEGILEKDGESVSISGKGNGPIDAFFKALHQVEFDNYEFVSYNEHAISSGADSKAVSYIELKKDGNSIFGVGIDSNISIASIQGILCAINRSTI